MTYQAMRRLLPGLLGIALLLLISPAAMAQKVGIGIFTEGERYETIYVPGKPGEVPSAPTIQAAVDMAKGPTFISVSLAESPGFMAEGKEIAVGLAGTTVNTSITFIGCPRAILIGYPNFTATSLIAFVKCQNILVQFGTTEAILIEDSSYGHVHENAINGGLYIRRSSGIAVNLNTLTHAAPSLVVSDCNDAPPASPPPLEWARYEMPYGRYTIAVGGCVFQKIGPTLIPTAAARLYDSRVLIRECRFEDLEVRGIESQNCQDVSLLYNTFNKIKEAGILFFNSEGIAEGNKMGGIAPGDFATSTGIYAATVGDKPARRTRVRLAQNEITDADRGILAANSTVEITGNKVYGGLFGVIVEDSSDGSIVGGLFRGTKFYGMALYHVAPGFLVENTTMDSVQGYGLLVDDSKSLTVKNVEWRAQCDDNCDHAENIRQPLVTGGIHIIASEVTLDYVRIGSRVTGAVLLVEAGFVDRRSTVQCTLSSFNAAGKGTGVIVDGSTVTGGFSSWDEARSVVAQYGAVVTLANSELISDINAANWGTGIITTITVESGSQVEMTQGQVTQTVLVSVTTDQVARAPDVVRVSGGSQIKLSGIGISGIGALLHLTGGSKGVFENCELSGTVTNETGANTGPADGVLVEDGDSLADLRNGKIYHQGGIGIRALFGGRIVANGLTVNDAKTYVQVDAGGKVELDSCNIGQNPNGMVAVRINSGGEAVIRNSSIGYFFDCAVKVASGGKGELTNCSIHNGNIGIQAEPGATLAQSGTRFTDVTAETAGAASSGGGQ
ncbi:MAG: right-handed parallel beta-helix repeat-containing protein [Blastocatellia bacterium]